MQHLSYLFSGMPEGIVEAAHAHSPKIRERISQTATEWTAVAKPQIGNSSFLNGHVTQIARIPDRKRLERFAYFECEMATLTGCQPNAGGFDECP